MKDKEKKSIEINTKNINEYILEYETGSPKILSDINTRFRIIKAFDDMGGNDLGFFILDSSTEQVMNIYFTDYEISKDINSIKLFGVTIEFEGYEDLHRREYDSRRAMSEIMFMSIDEFLTYYPEYEIKFDPHLL